jgi:prepilin-type N-terminal cleavage/methylation domain-containing protein
MHSFNNKNSAFSLIELIVTIGIIAILIAIATPIYVSYTIKSTVSSGLPILEGLKTQAGEYYTANGSFPTSLAAINATSYSDGKYISSSNVINIPYCRTGITTSLGAVQVIFSSPTAINGKILAMYAVDNGSAITWYCTSGDQNCPANGAINTDYLPKSCQ